METQKNHTNVDEYEIRKFAGLSSRWWDTQGELSSLHSINPLRLNYINSNTSLKGKRVLDIGCGGGILSESQALCGAEVTGIDLAKESLDVAHWHAMEAGINISYQQISAEDLAEISPSCWDIVTCMETLEHVPDPSSLIEACSKLTKTGGSVYFATINRNPKSFLYAIIGAEYILGLLPRGTHSYEKFICPAEMHQWCEQADLQMQEIIGMHYNPLLGTYSLGANVDVNYIARSVRV